MKTDKFNEIGSNFYITKLPKTQRSIQANEDILFLDSGRSAIRLVLKTIELEEKVAILPAYTCSTVIEPFFDDGYKIFYYDINEDMTINITKLEELVNKVNPKIVLVHSYFGKDTLQNARKYFKKLKDDGVYIIEDITQVLLNDNLDTETADFILGSIRKWFAIPDGGFLKNNSNKSIKYEKMTENENFVKKQIEAQRTKALYVENLDKNTKNKYMELFKESKEILDKNRDIYEISTVSKNILAETNIDFIKERRNNNYNYLNEKIKKFDFIKSPLGKMKANEIPLYYPILVNNSRKELQRFMAEANIYLPIIWPKSNEYLKNYKFNCDSIYKKMICIPCDQRYDIKDMERIIFNIEKFERGYKND